MFNGDGAIADRQAAEKKIVSEKGPNVESKYNQAGLCSLHIIGIDLSVYS